VFPPAYVKPDGKILKHMSERTPTRLAFSRNSFILGAFPRLLVLIEVVLRGRGVFCNLMRISGGYGEGRVAG